MLNFVTLFDSNYLSRGLALYSSLIKESSEDFVLYVLCMDDDVYKYFNSNKPTKIEMIKLSDVEDYYPVLKQIKQERSRGEYCWTLTPFVTQFVMHKCNLDHCTYIDSDIFFYASPTLIYDSMPKEKSVLITEHNYSPEYNQEQISGKYCVQFVLFKNDEKGNIVLEWWRQKCEEWCYNKRDGSRFGDQKYLDDWLTRFEGVYVCQQDGAGLAPWNVQKYHILNYDTHFIIQDALTKVQQQIIFFHFHGLKFVKKNKWSVGPYIITQEVKEKIYIPYAIIISEIEHNLGEIYSQRIKMKKLFFIRKIGGIVLRTIRYFIVEFRNVFFNGMYFDI